MTPMTLKQENACLAYVETGNKSEAYRRAFNASNMKEATINKRANEFFDRGDIKGRVAELRKPVIEQVQITLKTHLEKLAELRDKADASEKWQAAIQAEVARGKASGLYVEKHEHGGLDGKPIQHEVLAIKPEELTNEQLRAIGSIKINGA
jgi:phage terminase small subunit